jgi:hypothetical protein
VGVGADAFGIEHDVVLYWTPESAVDLHQSMLTGYLGSAVGGLDADGNIVGDVSGEGFHAALRRPFAEDVVPEPATLGPLALGVAAGFRRRKHLDQRPAQ